MFNYVNMVKIQVKTTRFTLMENNEISTNRGTFKQAATPKVNPVRASFLYATRIGTNGVLFFKHTFMPQDKSLPLKMRATAEWEKRKFEVLNDVCAFAEPVANLFQGK
jgi:hypothetical protein